MRQEKPHICFSKNHFFRNHEKWVFWYRKNCFFKAPWKIDFFRKIAFSGRHVHSSSSNSSRSISIKTSSRSINSSSRSNSSSCSNSTSSNISNRSSISCRSSISSSSSIGSSNISSISRCFSNSSSCSSLEVILLAQWASWSLDTKYEITLSVCILDSTDTRVSGIRDYFPYLLKYQDIWRISSILKELSCFSDAPWDVLKVEL